MLTDPELIQLKKQVVSDVTGHQAGLAYAIGYITALGMNFRLEDQGNILFAPFLSWLNVGYVIAGSVAQ